MSSRLKLSRREPEMQRVIAFPRSRACVRETPCISDLSTEDARRLGLLRDFLTKSRLSGTNDIEGACRRLIAMKPMSAESYGVTLFHALSVASHRQIVFNCRICPRASDDERWMLRLVEAQLHGDGANVRALLGFLIHRAWRRRIDALTAGLAERLDHERMRLWA